MKKEYSKERFHQIVSFLENANLTNEPNEEDGSIVIFNGVIGEYQSKVIGIIFVGTQDIKVKYSINFNLDANNQEEMDRISEMIIRINGILSFGNFALSYMFKKIEYSYTLFLLDMDLSQALINNLVCLPLHNLQKYLKGLELVKYKNVEPKTALEMCTLN